MISRNYFCNLRRLPIFWSFGVFMLNLIKNPLLAAFLVLTLAGCNSQEFYEKEFLDGVGVPEDFREIPDNLSENENTPNNKGNQIPADPNGLPFGNDPTNSNASSDLPNGLPTINNPLDPNGTNAGTNTADNTDSDSSGGPSSADNTDPDSSGGASSADNSDASGGSGDTDSDNSNGICGASQPIDAVDEFIQNSSQQAKVDILWVMDNSGSMGDEQEDLAKNFDIFINNFIKKDIDFQMAITTTDGRLRKSGKMIGDANLLNSDAAKENKNKFIDDFKQMIKVGVDGSGEEKGLQTSNDFFDNYRGWIRDDAYLVIVYISDEQDQSPDAVIDYVSQYQSLKSSVEKVRAYSIVTKSIDPDKKWESLGTRYEEASLFTGGETADIHQDFYTTLENFSFKILVLLDSFPLTGEPIDNKVEVTSNGNTLNSGWSYDSKARSISFDQNAIPNEGSLIKAYYQKCAGQ